MKKKLIFAAFIALLIVGLCLAAHYMPVWASITTVVAFVVGGFVGWFVKYFYDKYIKG